MDLTVFVSEAMLFRLNCIVVKMSCLGPSPIEVTFPLNAAERLKLSFTAVSGDQVVL